MQQNSSLTKITIADLIEPISDEMLGSIKGGNSVGHDLAQLNIQRALLQGYRVQLVFN